MYTKATLYFATGPNGEEEAYEFGADVEWEGGYNGSTQVSEPDVSAPDCGVDESSLIDPASLPAGWSEKVEEALAEAYHAHCQDTADSAADYAYDVARDNAMSDGLYDGYDLGEEDVCF